MKRTLRNRAATNGLLLLMSNNEAPEDSDEFDLSNVREDPDLAPEEKQTMYTRTKVDDGFNVYSEEGGVMRRLLPHPEADVEPDRVVDGNIVAVKGTIPNSLHKVLGNSRKDNSPAETVTDAYL